MVQVNVKEARNHLSSLLNKVEKGEEVIITRRGKKVARLAPPKKEVSKFPSLKSFRATIKMKGKTLSQTVIALREEERH
ncbi:MAG TPA: type II toxin-antitoxin system prevent-host-death family antitoxin [Nitrospinota bacterium]|nr:type II toxin-antitoxin system prevent-host-death family antitoxin [Nitrospinota bacterium]|tara:strand:+ start:359 stop:595 length:237 start_codon:yes stop_codon:yes gene_type:complete